MSETQPEAEPAPEPAGLSEDAVQEAINKAAGKARKEGRTKARAEVLELLGFDDLDTAQAAIADHKERVRAEMSEAELAREEAQAARREAEEAQRALTLNQTRATLSDALLEAGINPKRLKRALQFVDIEQVSDPDMIAAEVQALQEDVPELFAEPETGAPKPPAWAAAGGTGDKTKPSAGKTGIKAGRARYAEMKRSEG